MAFVQMSGGTFKQYKEWSVGDSIEGTVINKTPGKYGGNSIHIAVSKCDFEKDTVAVGSTFTLNSCSASKKLDQSGNLEIGTKIKVIYEGQGITKTGTHAGKPFNKVEFFCDMPEVEEDGAENGSAVDTSGL